MSSNPEDLKKSLKEVGDLFGEESESTGSPAGLVGSDEQYKKLINALVDEKNLKFTTELKDNEIHVLSEMERMAKKPLRSCPEFKLHFLLDYIHIFKVNRVALDRKRAQEIVGPLTDKKVGRKDSYGDFLLNRAMKVRGD